MGQRTSDKTVLRAVLPETLIRLMQMTKGKPCDKAFVCNLVAFTCYYDA